MQCLEYGTVLNRFFNRSCIRVFFKIPLKSFNYFYSTISREKESLVSQISKRNLVNSLRGGGINFTAPNLNEIFTRNL